MPPADPAIARWYADEVQPHEAPLRAWLASRFPNLADVDDIVQESVMRVLRARGSGPILSPKSLLFVAARNLALNRLRDAQREPVQSLADFDLGGVLYQSLDGIRL